MHLPPARLQFLRLALCALLPLHLAAAEPTASVSLRDAVQTALKQSPGLRIQEAGIEQKSGLLDQASGAFDWVGTGAANVANNRTPVIDASGAKSVDRNTETTYAVGAGKLFRNGVSIQPSVSVVQQDSHSTSTPTTGASQLNFQIDVPLLRGLGTNSTGATEAAARGDVAVARLLYQHALTAQAYNTAAAYWNCRAADETLKLQVDVERAAEKLVESTKVLVDTRVFPPVFLMQAEANLRDKRTVRIEAELSAKSARFALGQVLGLAPEAIAATPTPTDEFPLLSPTSLSIDEASRAALVQRALADRADLVASRGSLVPLNILARQAESNLKPRLDLTVSAGYRGLSTGGDPLGPLTQRLTGGNGLVGLSAEWPVRNTYQHGLLRERRADLRAAEAQTVQLSQQVAGEVLLALEQVRLRADVVRSAQDTVDIARKAVAAQYDQLRSGLGTILDVINIESLYTSARINNISAHAAYATAIVQLRYALGSVFESAADHSFTVSDLTTPPPLQPPPVR